ncbi:outer membrane beta-barrel protein [Algoriphagus antarcticus]|uniref:Outer membrane protein with beta-barrel domain n=1 Tax=Algoriphagus antarcticus TaxID=238540 RepID=A0A3E0DZS0_9BACT|nr:outer membrane beta-barrel protein [Algoriphagus antarcticus]REG91562.1 outer membrane protein with beta-barrel domain [Algoriphagus antarcticus]
MRKLLMILMMVCGAGMYAQAQVLKPGVGLNFTDFTTNSGEASAKAGWQIGASMAFGNKVYIEPGLFYVGKSSEYSDPNNATQNDFKADFNGLRIPVAVGVNILGDSETTATLRAFGGASAFILTSVGDSFDKDDFKSASYGVFAGAGVDFSILFVELAYEWSVTDLSDVQTIDVGKSRGLYATAGLRFRL